MRTIARRSVAVIAVVVLSLAPAVAHAGDGFPPPIGGDGQVGGGGNGGGSGSGTGTGTSGGSGGGGSSAPEGTKWVYGGVRLTEAVWAWNRPGGIELVSLWGGKVNGACPPREVSGDPDWLATGATWQHLVNVEDNTWAGSYSYSCNYPPEPRDYALTCSLSMTGIITQERPSTSVRTIVDKTVSGPWASDRESIAKCRRPLSIGVSAAMDALGGYLVKVTGRTVPCTARTYPGTNRPDRIIRCGTTRTSTQSKKGAVWCSGGRVRWATGPNVWTGKDWTWAGCTRESIGVIQCNTATDLVTWDGRTISRGTPGNAFDSNAPQTLRFPGFAPGGQIVSIDRLRSILEVRKDATPVRRKPGQSQPRLDGDDQPLVFDGPVAVDGDRRSWALGFLAASEPESPFAIRLKRSFDAVVAVKVTVIERVDFAGLKITTSTETRHVQAEGLSCVTPYGEVDVHRARLATG